MAFDLKNVGGYLNGEMGDISIEDGIYDKINSYVRVKKITGNVIEIDIDSMAEGNYVTFRAGTEIMLHVSCTNRTTADYLGKYIFTTITLVSNDTLTLDKNVGEFFDGVDLDYESVQAIAVINADCVHLEKGGILTPPVFNPYTFVGGILVIKCWNTFYFNGGHILLEDCGIPVNRKNSLRPLASQETEANGESDFDKLSGQENFITADRFLLNAGDGACMIIAKRIVCSENSRIGNPNTHGAAYCRGHKTSVGVKPSNITNAGGSTILLAADKIENFTPKIIAKYRSSDKPEGRGLARCYIASNTTLPADEGLYSYDILSNTARVRNLGVEDFGNGSFGDFVNPTAPFNNYAAVSSISQDGHKFNFSNKTLNGLATFKNHSLVLAVAVQKNTSNVEDAGKFIVGRVLSINSDSIVLDKPLNVDAEIYNVQLVSIPEFANLTLANNHAATPAYNGKTGGICAVAVAGQLNIESGKLNVEGKGGAPAYGKNGLQFIGNSQNNARLPIGEGHGSIFILAKEIIMNENSRLGATYSGAGTGGRLGGNNATATNFGGGYVGNPDEDNQGSGGGFIHGGSYGGLGGSGFSRGTNTLNDFDCSKVATDNHNLDGAHLMIIADKIRGFSQNAISTGGKGSGDAGSGAAGFGGGGSKFGAGGDSGFAFIYVNSCP